MSPEQLGELLRLLKGASSVELKLSVPEENRRSTVTALGMDPLAAQIRQVMFFDTPDLVLNRAGVVLRARRVQGRDGDTVVKLRPVVPDELPRSLRASQWFTVEVDAMPNGFVCSASLGIRLGIAGLLISVGTLLVVAWADERFDLITTTTMGLTTISLLHIVAALEWRDPERSIFHRETIANGRFNLMMLGAFALTFLATTIDGLNRLLDTTELDGQQWRVILVAVIGYVVLAELGKLLFQLVARRRRPAAPSLAGATTS